MVAGRLTCHDHSGVFIHGKKYNLLGKLRNKASISFSLTPSSQVFIETPHRATEFESWESISTKLLLRRKDQGDCPSSTASEQLANTLMKLSKSFQVMARIYPIVNLYECINEEALRSTPLVRCSSPVPLLPSCSNQLIFINYILSDIKAVGVFQRHANDGSPWGSV